ncbi:hypothetical protein D3C81_2164470 [compost metagenome]
MGSVDQFRALIIAYFSNRAVHDLPENHIHGIHDLQPAAEIAGQIDYGAATGIARIRGFTCSISLLAAG